MRRLLLIAAASFLLPLTGYAAETFTLHTSSFTPTNPMPKNYTCDGKDISPELDWSAIPDKTKSLALIFIDTNKNFYHWVVYNIPAEVLSFPEGIMDDPKQLPTGVLIGMNSFDKQRYNGPCPPAGETHNYKFTLYALDTTLTLPASANAQAVLNAMQNHTLGQVELSTKYGR